MSDQALSAGAIRAIYNDVNQDDDPIVSEPVLQVLSIKKVVSNGSAADRYRMIVSDGEHFIQAMLATQLNHLITADPPAIDKNTVIKLLTYACNSVQGRKIIICLSFDTLYHADEKIGAAVTIDPAAGAAAAAPAVAAPAPAPAAAPKPVAKKPAATKGGNSNPSGTPIFPIESLSPYQNKWTIKARVTSKSDIRHWTNAKGEGKLFSVNLLDESGEIKATGFNEQVESFHTLLEEGKVYLISRARVNIAKKQFSNLSNEYEIMFERNTEINLCEDQDSAPQIKYSFVELGNLSSMEKDQTCDVLGIVTDNGDVNEITSKATSKQIKKRDLTIADRSGYSCRVTLWGRMAESWVDLEQGVVALKGARVGDFGGRTLSLGGQATISVDPDIPEAHALQGWFETDGRSTNFVSQSSGGAGAAGGSFKKDDFKTLDRIDAEGMGYDEKPSFFSTRATVTMIKPENLFYPACPTEKCNKKVQMEAEDQWRCEKCDSVYPAPEYRYIMSMCVADHTTQQWISTFNEAGEQVLGKSANALNQLKEDDEAAFTAAIATAMGKTFNFSLRAKAETYSDQTRVKCIVQRIAEVPWVQAANDLLADIAKYT